MITLDYLVQMKYISIDMNLELSYEPDYCWGHSISVPQYDNMLFYGVPSFYYMALKTNTWITDSFDDYIELITNYKHGT